MTEEEIVRMMYATEISQRRVENIDEIYTAHYGSVPDDDEWTLLRRYLRCNVLEDMSRIFFLNLCSALNRAEEITLEDLFCLLTMWEGDLNYHASYNTSEERSQEYCQILLENYSQMFESFLNMVADSNSMTPDSLAKQFAEYRLFVDTADGLRLNAPLSLLSDAQKKRLLYKACSSRIEFTAPVIKILSEDSDLP